MNRILTVFAVSMIAVFAAGFQSLDVNITGAQECDIDKVHERSCNEVLRGCTKKISRCRPNVAIAERDKVCERGAGSLKCLSTRDPDCTGTNGDSVSGKCDKPDIVPIDIDIDIDIDLVTLD